MNTMVYAITVFFPCDRLCVHHHWARSGDFNFTLIFIGGCARRIGRAFDGGRNRNSESGIQTVVGPSGHRKFSRRGGRSGSEQTVCYLDLET